jgi:hypothetical protein
VTLVDWVRLPAQTNGIEFGPWSLTLLSVALFSAGSLHSVDPPPKSEREHPIVAITLTEEPQLDHAQRNSHGLDVQRSTHSSRRHSTVVRQCQ